MFWTTTRGLTPAGQGLLASWLEGLATGLGGLLVVLLPHLSRRVYDALLGFSGGVMLSAAALALLWPALQPGGISAIALRCCASAEPVRDGGYRTRSYFKALRRKVRSAPALDKQVSFA